MEFVASSFLKRNVPVWFVSLDLRETFGRGDTLLYLKPFILTDCQMVISLFFNNFTLTSVDPQMEATRSNKTKRETKRCVELAVV